MKLCIFASGNRGKGEEAVASSFVRDHMIQKEAIRQVVESKIKELDGFLVNIEVNTANVVRVFFDRMDGVNVDHCLELSKHIEAHFDREVEDYELTVCSAGLDSSFLVDEQYKKYEGKEVGVLLTNGKRKKGIIISYEDEKLILEVKKKKKGNRKQYIIEQIAIAKSEIKETKLKINFK